MEEVSWGQGMGMPVPSFMLVINAQNSLSIHNLDIFQPWRVVLNASSNRGVIANGYYRLAKPHDLSNTASAQRDRGTSNSTSSPFIQ